MFILQGWPIFPPLLLVKYIMIIKGATTLGGTWHAEGDLAKGCNHPPIAYSCPFRILLHSISPPQLWSSNFPLALWDIQERALHRVLGVHPDNMICPSTPFYLYLFDYGYMVLRWLFVLFSQTALSFTIPYTVVSVFSSQMFPALSKCFCSKLLSALLRQCR